jgi:hypothetical protein
MSITPAPVQIGRFTDKEGIDLVGAVRALWDGDWGAYDYRWRELAQTPIMVILGGTAQLVWLCSKGLLDHQLLPDGDEDAILEAYTERCSVVPPPYGLDPAMLAETMEVALATAYGEQDGGWAVLLSDPSDSLARLLAAAATLLAWLADSQGMDRDRLLQSLVGACPVPRPV